MVSNVTSGSDETLASSSSALGAPENQDEGCRVVNMAAEVILEFDEKKTYLELYSEVRHALKLQGIHNYFKLTTKDGNVIEAKNFTSEATGNITLSIQPCGYIHKLTEDTLAQVTEFNNFPDMDRQRLQSKFIQRSLIPERQIELSIVFAKVTNIPQFDPPETAEGKLRVEEQLKPKLFEALKLFVEAYGNRDYGINAKLDLLAAVFTESNTLETAEFDWNWDNCAVLIKLEDVKLIIYFSKNGIFYLSELVDCTPLGH